MGILSGNPKNEPMHYGEIFSVWSASMLAKGMVSCYEAYLNHAGDKDLKKFFMICWIRRNSRLKNAMSCLPTTESRLHRGFPKDPLSNLRIFRLAQDSRIRKSRPKSQRIPHSDWYHAAKSWDNRSGRISVHYSLNIISPRRRRVCESFR